MTALTYWSLVVAIAALSTASWFASRTVRSMLELQRQQIRAQDQEHEEVRMLHATIEQDRRVGYQRDSLLMEKLEKLEQDILPRLEERVLDIEKWQVAQAQAPPVRRGMNVGGDA